MRFSEARVKLTNTQLNTAKDKTGTILRVN